MASRLTTLWLLTLLSSFAIIITLYWSACWAWLPWQPLPLGCPTASEEVRYGAGVDVLISSHDAPKWRHPIALLPSGRQLLYEGRVDQQLKLYDLETGSRQPVTLPEQVFYMPEYISDEWALVQYASTQSEGRVEAFGASMVNLESHERVPLTTIDTDTSLHQGIPAHLHPLIQQHPLVYIVRGNLVLVSTSLGDTSAPTYLIRGYLGAPERERTELIAAQLRELGVEPIYRTSIYAPDQRYYFYPSDKTISWNTDEPPTILDAQRQQVLVTSHLTNYELMGWTAKQDGVVMVPFDYPCLYGHLACIPQPILLLRQSSDQLSPELQAQFAAKDAQEAQVKLFADLFMVVLIAITAILLVVTVRAYLVRPHLTPIKAA